MLGDPWVIMLHTLWQGQRSLHTTPILKELHWLPVKLQIDFKLILLTYSCFHGTAPQYLCELILLYTPARALWSSSESCLTIPEFHDNTNKKCFGALSFRSSAPAHWNSLPQSLKLILPLHLSSVSWRHTLSSSRLIPTPTHHPSLHPPSLHPFLTFHSIPFLFVKLVIDLFYLHIFYILPTLCHEHALHGVLFAHYKLTAIIIIIIIESSAVSLEGIYICPICFVWFLSWFQVCWAWICCWTLHRTQYWASRRLWGTVVFH